jgi:mono/diheme cytochrome c family protein
MRRAAAARAPCARAAKAARAVLCVVASFTTPGALLGAAGAAPPRGPAAESVVVVGAAVEPVRGESWIERKNLTFGGTSLGWMGRSGPSRADATPSVLPAPDPPGPGILLTGSDLYRVSCSSCHGASGAGAPPEIRSVFGPTQATSAEFLIERVRARGLSLEPRTARDMAAQAEKSIRDRLHDGGERMPSFEHLDAAEVDAILDHLRELAGVRPKGARNVAESVFRVGENVVRGTCLTCHAATGPGPRDVASLAGATQYHVRPSLAGIASELSLSQFEAKVRAGVPSSSSEERGVMPRFDYLRPEEVRAAFLYLVAFPPARVPELASRR